MDKSNFIYFKEIVDILGKNSFYGFTAHRESNRITYTYHSVRYPNVIISVKTLKLNQDKIPSEKIVLGIKFNNIEINGWKEFIDEIKNLNKNYKTKYGNTKKN